MKIVNCLAIYITSAFAFGCTKNDSSVVNHDMTLSQSKEINLLVEAHTNPDEVRRLAELGDAEAQYALGGYRRRVRAGQLSAKQLTGIVKLETKTTLVH